MRRSSASFHLIYVAAIPISEMLVLLLTCAEFHVLSSHAMTVHCMFQVPSHCICWTAWKSGWVTQWCVRKGLLLPWPTPKRKHSVAVVHCNHSVGNIFLSSFTNYDRSLVKWSGQKLSDLHVLKVRTDISWKVLCLGRSGSWKGRDHDFANRLVSARNCPRGTRTGF